MARLTLRPSRLAAVRAGGRSGCNKRKATDMKQQAAIKEQPALSKPVCCDRDKDQVCVLLAPHPGIKHISGKGRQW